MIHREGIEVNVFSERGSPKREIEKIANIENWLTDVSEHTKEWTFTEEVCPPTTRDKSPPPTRDRKVHIAEDTRQTAEENEYPRGETPQITVLRRELTSYRVGRRPTNTSLSLGMMPKPVRVYKNTCKKLKILPLRRVLGQFGKSRVVLSDLCMSSADVRATCKALKYEECSYLDISGNMIGETEAHYIVDLLINNRKFTELRLADNCLSGRGIVTIGNYFDEVKVITFLDISGNKLTDNDGLVVAKILKTNRQLRVLHAHHNEFRDIAGKAIGKAIAENSGLEELNLSWNHLRQQGAIGLARGLEKNQSLEYLNIGWNGFGFEGCVALSEVLRSNTTLEKLDISCNRIHPPALLELMKGLCNNKVLKVLVMDRNPMTPSFTSVLLENIKKHKTMALQELSLEGVVVDRDFKGIYESIQEERRFNVTYETSLPVSCKSREEMIREVEMQANYNVEPLRMLYLLKEKNRAQDFFHKINKDHNDCLTPDELFTLFKESGIPVSKFVIDKIMDFMDTDHDGRIDLGEFLVGDKKIKKISRDLARNSLQVGEEDHYSRYSRTFRKAHIEQLTSRLHVEETQRYLSPIASPSPSMFPSPASSRRSSFNFP